MMTVDITSIPRTLCSLMEIPPPHVAEGPALARPLEAARQAGALPIERCLIFAPDAIGAFLWTTHTADLSPVLEYAPVRQPIRSVVPPKTPVCFASMLTGASPDVHGIRKYERPVVKHDTLFDALIRAGRRVAVVAVRDSSMDVIFRGREMAYFSEPYDQDVTERTLHLLEADAADVIVAYQQEYDDTLHQTTPLSPECVEAMKRHVAAFCVLARGVEQHWSAYNRAVMFTPDHGAHIDPKTGHGDHGEDIPEDMEIIHCFGVRAKD